MSKFNINLTASSILAVLIDNVLRSKIPANLLGNYRIERNRAAALLRQNRYDIRTLSLGIPLTNGRRYQIKIPINVDFRFFPILNLIGYNKIYGDNAAENAISVIEYELIQKQQRELQQPQRQQQTQQTQIQPTIVSLFQRQQQTQQNPISNNNQTTNNNNTINQNSLNPALL